MAQELGPGLIAHPAPIDGHERAVLFRNGQVTDWRVKRYLRHRCPNLGCPFCGCPFCGCTVCGCTVCRCTVCRCTVCGYGVRGGRVSGRSDLGDHCCRAEQTHPAALSSHWHCEQFDERSGADDGQAATLRPTDEGRPRVGGFALGGDGPAGPARRIARANTQTAGSGARNAVASRSAVVRSSSGPAMTTQAPRSSRSAAARRVELAASASGLPLKARITASARSAPEPVTGQVEQSCADLGDQAVAGRGGIVAGGARSCGPRRGGMSVASDAVVKQEPSVSANQACAASAKRTASIR